MAFLGRSRKDDLKTLAEELGLVVGENFKVIQLIELITKSDKYDDALVKNMLQVITEERVAREKRVITEERVARERAEKEKLDKEQKYELEKLHLQLKYQRLFTTDDLTRRKFHFVKPIQECCDDVTSYVSETAAPLVVRETDHPDQMSEDEVTSPTPTKKLELKDPPDPLRKDEVTNLMPTKKLELKDHPDPLRKDEDTNLTPLKKLELENHHDHLREDEGIYLTPLKQTELKDHPDQILEDEGSHQPTVQKSGFCLGGEATPECLTVDPEKTVATDTKYFVANDSPNLQRGVYHTSALKPFRENKTSPVRAMRRRGRPPRIKYSCSPTPANAHTLQNTPSADPWSGRLRGQRGRL